MAHRTFAFLCVGMTYTLLSDTVHLVDSSNGGVETEAEILGTKGESEAWGGYVCHFLC